MQKYFKLYFGTDQDKTSVITIPDARVDASEATVKTAGTSFIAGDVADKNGVLTVFKKAITLEREIEEFDVSYA